jgi:excisionase family DNA binding protein
MALREVAEYLGCSKVTVYRLLKHGEFPAFRLGGDWRFRRSDIDKWIAQQQQQAPQPEETPSKPRRRGRPRQRRDSLRD